MQYCKLIKINLFGMEPFCADVNGNIHIYIYMHYCKMYLKINILFCCEIMFHQSKNLLISVKYDIWTITFFNQRTTLLHKICNTCTKTRKHYTTMLGLPSSTSATDYNNANSNSFKFVTLFPGWTQDMALTSQSEGSETDSYVC